MLSPLRTIPFRILSIGYVSSLLFFDAFLMILIVIDYWRFMQTSRSTLAPILHIGLASSAWSTFRGVQLLTFLLVIVPMMGVLIRLLMPKPQVMNAFLGRRGIIVVTVHIFSSFLIVSADASCISMSILCGASGSLETEAAAFTSWFTLFPVNVMLGTTQTVGSLGAILFVGFIWRIIDGKPPESITKLHRRVSLTYLPYFLYPRFGRHRLNFSGVLSPILDNMERSVGRDMQRYDAAMPGSSMARKYAKDLVKETTCLMKELAIIPNGNDEIDVEIYSGTSRALDVALSRALDSNVLLISPYEHPTESVVANWLMSRDQNLRVQTLSMKDAYFDKTIDEQWDHFCKQVNNKKKGGTYAGGFTLLISDVCYSTGLELPVTNIVERLRKKVANSTSNVNLICDGAHAVGNNGLIRTRAGWDAYVFSPHKWLMAPYPCGVLLRPKGKIADAVRPYDAIAGDVSTMTCNVQVIAGLKAALELIHRVGFKEIWERSAYLRDILESKISDRFRIVGKESKFDPTSLLSVAPHYNKKWKFGATDLEDRADKARISLTVLQHGENLWLRIAIPFYLDKQDMLTLGSWLNDCVE